jgi:hypothetical protein
VIRKLNVGLSALVTVGLAVSPAAAQRKTQPAGVSWSGAHGGVSWDGGHAYEGGGYGGYPAAAPPRPAYKMPQLSPYLAQAPLAQPERRDDAPRAQHRGPRRSD